MKFLLCVLFLLSASVASAQCPPGGCKPGVFLRRPFVDVRAPAGSSIHYSRGLFRARIYVNGLGTK